MNKSPTSGGTPVSAPDLAPDPVASRGPDAELVARLLEGDEASFIAIVNGYSSGLLRVASLFVSSRAVAEEVVQDTWLAVLDALPSFEGRSSLKTWVFRILSNRAKTRAEKEGRTTPFSASGIEEGGEPAVDPARFAADGRWLTDPGRWQERDPERLAMHREAISHLESALENLPPAQRAVVVLRDVEGLEAAEVCNILSISESNERVLLHRGRSRLRAELGEHLERRQGR